MLGAQGVSVCARVCQQRELGECVLSSTSARSLWSSVGYVVGATGRLVLARLLPDPAGCGALSCHG